MTLFWWLLFAHLLADFPLQTNKIYDLKTKKLLGVIIHGSIFGVLATITSIPFWLKNPYILFFILILWISHIYIDKTKLLANTLTCHRTTSFFIDQFIHIALIFLVYSIPSVKNTDFFSNAILQKYYYDPMYIIVISGYLTTSYVGLVTRLVFREGSLHPASKKFQMPSLLLVIWEIIERAIITTAVWLGTYFYFLIIPGIISIVIRKKMDIDHKYDFIFSIIWAVAIGIGMRLLLR